MRRFGLVTISMLMMLATACRVEAVVRIDVVEDGSGTVTVEVALDGAATDAAGDLSLLRTEDLTAAGWLVGETTADSEGGVVLQATREVASPAQLGTVLDEVGGAQGIFEDVRLGIEDEFGSTSYEFTGRVELTGDPSQFSDGAVTEALGGLPLGRTPEELAFVGADDPETFTIAVEVALPGGEPDANGVVSGPGPWVTRWDFSASGGEPTSAELGTSAQVSDPTRGILLVVGGLAGAAALAAGVAALVLRRS